MPPVGVFSCLQRHTGEHVNMADQTSAGDPQAGDPEQPQAGDNQAQPQAGDANRDGQEKVYSATAYKKVQSEAINLRERLRKYEEAEKAGMTEAERLQKEREDFNREREAFEQTKRATLVEGIARQMGAVYPDVMVTLISQDADSERDIKRALATLQAEKPAMFKTASIDGGAGGSAQVEADMNSLIRQRINGATRGR